MRPDGVVYDVGAGLGVLGLYAAKLGAKIVYLVENNRILEIAEQVARDNNIRNVRFIKDDVRFIEIEEKADVIVCEGIGNFFVTDEMQSVYRSLKRLAKDDTIFIPDSITLYIVPAFILPFNGIRFWENCNIRGIDFSAVANFALNRAYVLDIPEGFLVSEPEIYVKIHIPDVPDHLHNTMSFVVQKSGMRLTGFVGWFKADLGKGIVLDTGPGIRTHWGQMLFPVREFPLQKDDVIELTLDLSIDEHYRNVFAWDGRVIRHGSVVREFHHSSLRRYEIEPVE